MASPSVARHDTFSGPKFDPYRLTGVRVTDQELGRGAYATVLELEYMKVKCAGKKIHEILIKPESGSGGSKYIDNYVVKRFEEECALLSKIRHPNIVQFLGLYYEKGVRVPMLVMEFHPLNLTSCIEDCSSLSESGISGCNDILPKEISYSILHDVALGLYYLHSQTPAVIHRDLSANNVLLTYNMTAKIADLGVARILNLTPLQIGNIKFTQTPGSPAYMPPEVMIANPEYDTSLDVFSYGVLMIHVFSGRWPEPQVGQTIIESDKLIPVTEAERREVFLQAIGNDHPLMDLILRCINNDPKRRVQANEIVECVAVMVSQLPVSSANRLEMLRLIESQREEIKSWRMTLEKKDTEVQNAQSSEEKLAKEIERLEMVHSTQTEQLRVQLGSEKSSNILLTSDRNAATNCVLELESELETQRKAMELKDSDYSTMNYRLENVLGYLESNKVCL